MAVAGDSPCRFPMPSKPGTVELIVQLNEDTAQAIEKSKGRLAWFEKRLADLKVHLAGLPSVGCHRPEFLRTHRVIQFVKRALEEEREQLDWLHVSAKEDEEFEAKREPIQFIQLDDEDRTLTCGLPTDDVAAVMQALEEDDQDFFQTGRHALDEAMLIFASQKKGRR